ELGRRRCNAHDVAMRLDDIRDRRANDWHARRHVLKRLRGADETRRSVACERQDADIPAAQKGRQLVVRALVEVMNVRAPREAGGRDLDDRTYQDNLPVGPAVGERRKQGKVESLVNDAEESDAWTGQMPLIRVLVAGFGGPGEMATVYAARKAVH